MTSDLLTLFRGRLVAAAALALLNGALLAGLTGPTLERGRASATGPRAGTAADLAETRRLADAFLASFPARSHLLAVTGRVQTLARELGLRVPALDYRPETAAGAPLERVAVSMRVEGPYPAVRRLLHGVETLPRSLVIDAATLRGSPDGRRVQLALDLSVYSALSVPADGVRRAPPVADVPAFLASLVDYRPPAYAAGPRDLFHAGFAGPSSVPRAPRASPVAPPVATAVVAASPGAAPPDPGRADEASGLRLLGTGGFADVPRAFVGVAGEVLVVRRGDRVGSRYVVKDIYPESIVLRSPSGDREVTLSLREGSRHAP